MADEVEGKGIWSLFF